MALAEKVYSAVYAGEGPPLHIVVDPPSDVPYNPENKRDEKLAEWGLMVGLAYAIAVQEDPFDSDNDKRAREAATAAFSRVRSELGESGCE